MKQHDNDSLSPGEHSLPGADPFAEGDPLWDLLGQARETTVSPFFARNAARTARIAKSARGSLDEKPQRLVDLLRTLFRWRFAAIATSSVALAVIVISSISQQAQWSYGTAVADNKTIDFDIIKNLDELLAMEESSEETALWLNASLN